MADAITSSQHRDTPHGDGSELAPKFTAFDTFRALPGFYWNGASAFLKQAHDKYGEVVRMNFAGFDTTSICHPDHIRRMLATNEQDYVKGSIFNAVKPLLGNGLFISEGELWRSQRRLLQPEFTRHGVNNFVDGIAFVGNLMTKEWEQHIHGDPVDIYDEMRHAAMRVICHTALDYEVNEKEDSLSVAIDEIIQIINNEAFGFLKLPGFVPTPTRRKFKKHLKALDNTIYEIIGNQDGDPDGNFVQRLIAARDDETGYSMTSELLRDEIMTVFLAGHETTALSLTWAWYLLSKNPSAERKMHEEIDSVLSGRTPGIDDLDNLPYTLAVFKESMRLYPPIWLVPREVAKDDFYNGYRVKAKSMILAATCVTHYLPEFWENPTVFKPERFLPENEEKQHNYAYLPFGAGPRTCMGNHFAMREAQILLAQFGQRYRLRLAPRQMVHAKVEATLRPAKPLKMFIEER